MLQCRVCGRDFDPLRFQVVVPGLGQGFDRVECAEQARALLGPSAAPVPLPAVVRPVPAPSPALAAVPALTSLAGARTPVLVGANLALLAAGTVATVYLWFRVFGADPSALEIPRLGGEPAFERGTVPADISTRQPRESPRRAAPEATIVSSGPPTAPPAPAPAGGNGGTTSPPPTLVSGPVRSGGGDGDGGAGAGAGGGSALGPEGPTMQPRPAAPARTGRGQGHGRSGTAPHGKAKGHDKPHGPVANHDKPHGAGHGKKVGHDKHH